MAKDGVKPDWLRMARRALACASATLAVLALFFGAATPTALVLASLATAGSLVQLLVLDGDLALLAYLPAVWLALRAELGGAGAQLLPAAALAFQARVWLLELAAVRKRERLELADRIEANRPATVTVFVDNDIESEVPLGTLRDGHTFRVSPGQILPADGLVTFGSGFVDESLISADGAEGEADLRMKGMGSAVTAGSRNRNATLLVRAHRVGEDTFAARLTAALRRNTSAGKALLPDAAGAAVALLLGLAGGGAAAFGALLAGSGAAAYAALAAADFSLARAGATRRWLWDREGLSRLARSGMLVTAAPWVLTEGRPKLSAVETTGSLSEDAALGLLGPLARKLETPAAFALLLELRARNIPLQLADYYEPRESGGMVFLAGEEIQWVSLNSSEALPLGPLASFVREHENAGEEIALLARQGTVQAALAFRDTLVKGAPDAAAALRDLGYPVLLVSALPKSCTARLQTELGVEHAQGESGDRETDALVTRLASEKLAPAWVQTQALRPAKATAIVGRALATDRADLLLPDPSLPDVAAAFAFATQARGRLRLALGLLYGVQAGLLLALVSAEPAIAPLLHLGTGWRVSAIAVAIVGAIPGFAAFFLAHVRPPDGP